MKHVSGHRLGEYVPARMVTHATGKRGVFVAVRSEEL
jgi:hypothetical protein